MDSLKYDIFSMKSQELKFHAFFSYLKSFSEASIDTLQKLDNQFHKEVKKKHKEKEILTNMKNILSSYEIFILEIKDSCDFIEIPEFGFCIGKTFLQMIKIIKWFLRSWLKNSVKYEAIKFRLETEQSKNTDMEEPQQAVCTFCQELIKHNPYGKDNKNKRKAVALDSCLELNTAKKNYMKERNHMMEFQEQLLEKYTMKEISSKRYISDYNEPDVLTRKYAAMKMEFSNKDNVLEEILNEFNLKTEAIARFVNHSQIVSLEDFKMSSGANYDIIEAEIKAKIAEKYEEAKQKLKDLVATKLQEYEKKKKSKMVDKNVQANFYEFTEKEKMQGKIKQLTVTIRQLRNQVESQKQLNESLKKLLESKSIQFEEEFLSFRKKHILNNSRECDSKSFLKSLKTLKDILDENELIDKQNPSIGSFKMEETIVAPPVHRKSVKKRSLFKEKTSQGKKKNSIKFTLENDHISEEQDNFRQTVFSECSSSKEAQENQCCFASTATQTDSLQSQFDFSATQTPLGRKFYILNRDNSLNKQNLKIKREQRVKRSGDIQQLYKKTTPLNMYSHVKSKVYESVQTSRPMSSKYSKTKETPELNNLVKKLAGSYLIENKASDDIQSIPSAKSNIDPTFCSVVSVSFSSEDVFNLYLTQKNAQNYQCLLYRNSIFSNMNPKRSVNYQKKFESSDLEWNFKKDYEGADSLENKIAAVIFQQLCAIKKREKSSYDQLKLILRAPTHIDNNTEIINLQTAKEENKKDIDISQLKKMMNIILRFHLKCLGKQKEALCGHLVQFCSKIGIKFS